MKTKIITLRVTEQEKNEIKRAAKSRYMSLNSYVKWAVLIGVKQK